MIGQRCCVSYVDLYVDVRLVRILRTEIPKHTNRDRHNDASMRMDEFCLLFTWLPQILYQWLERFSHEWCPYMVRWGNLLTIYVESNERPYHGLSTSIRRSVSSHLVRRRCRVVSWAVVFSFLSPFYRYPPFCLLRFCLLGCLLWNPTLSTR